MTKVAKNTICLWYDGNAEDSARFYAATFPDSSIDAVHLAPGVFPSGKEGDVLTVRFKVNRSVGSWLGCDREVYAFMRLATGGDVGILEADGR